MLKAFLNYSLMKCSHRNCSHPVEAGRKECRRCRARRYRERNPVASAYSKLKANAKRRGKPFDLTLAEFREFCVATDYIKNKGRGSTCYHVDRIDETKGYTRNNIQVLTNQENKQKYVRFAYHYNHEEGRMEFNTTICQKPKRYEEDPF